MSNSIRGQRSLLLRLIIIGSMSSLILCSCGPSSLEKDPEKVFRNYVLEKIPSGVTDIQAIQDSWKDIHAFIRFKATSEAFGTIMASGLKERKWEDIKDRFILPSGWDKFEPKWNPEGIENKRCYWEQQNRNAGVSIVDNYYVIDDDTNIVYVHATD